MDQEGTQPAQTPDQADAVTPITGSSVEAVLQAHPGDHLARLLVGYSRARSMDALRQRFRQLALNLHPDRCNHPLGPAAFQAVNSAWTALRNTADREAFGLTVEQAAAELRGWRWLRPPEGVEEATAPEVCLDTPSGGSQPDSYSDLSTESMRQRVTAILLAAESREQRFNEQMQAAGRDSDSRARPDPPTSGTGPSRKAMTKRARKTLARRRSNFVKPADPSLPTRHLHIANTGPAFGVSCAAISAAFEVSGWHGVVITEVDQKCPFIYATFKTMEEAEAARAQLDRRSPSSSLFLGRVLQVDYAEAVLPVAVSHRDRPGDTESTIVTTDQILERLRMSLTPAAKEDEAGNLPEISQRVIPTQAPVHCPLCMGDPFAVFCRGRAFRMHLKSPVHSVEEGPLMVRIIELAEREADVLEAQKRESHPEGDEYHILEEEGATARGPVAEEAGLAAARDGELAELRELVAAGWDAVGTTDRHGSTALHFAAGAGHLKVCQFLVNECGVPAGQHCESGRRDLRNALHWAARNGHLAVCSWLVHSGGVDINAATSDKTNAFHWAVWQARFEVCRWLVDNGCNWQAVNDWGCTAVHWAALQGNLPILKWLSLLGLGMGHQNHQGHSALHKAAYKGHSEVCSWLLRNSAIDARQQDRGGYTPATIARLQHHGELANILEAAEMRSLPGCTEPLAAPSKPQYCFEGPLGVLVEQAGGETGDTTSLKSK